MKRGRGIRRQAGIDTTRWKNKRPVWIPITVNEWLARSAFGFRLFVVTTVPSGQSVVSLPNARFSSQEGSCEYHVC